ncbi:MAG: hypothetical protein P1V51_06890 [Deltaproteobacteria bacterium]|nr:hypothetical protein [Deltaproteobacteria bacterium]
MAGNTRGSARSSLGLLEVTDAGLPRRVNRPSLTRTAHAEPAPTPAVGLDEEATRDPLYPVALLKIAMAMRRLGPEEELHFDSILQEVMDDLALDKQAFRSYLDKNMGRLMAAVRARGY